MTRRARRYERRVLGRQDRDPYQVGCDDRYKGVARDACPFTDVAEVSEWRAGWHATDAALARVAAPLRRPRDVD